MRWILLLLLMTFFFSSCQSVKPYQRAYLNDHHMQLGVDKLCSFMGQVHVYREGASGGGSGKSSGGCGCN